MLRKITCISISIIVVLLLIHTCCVEATPAKRRYGPPLWRILRKKNSANMECLDCGLKMAMAFMLSYQIYNMNFYEL